MKYIFPILILVFVGCSSKQNEKQTDEQVYQEIIKFINHSNLDKADELYMTLKSEHFNSPLLETATMLMIQSHSKRENYLLAEHYIENYERVYGTAENRPYFKYLRIKSKYFAFQNPRRDQKLLNDTLELIEDYIYDYKSSPYIPYVKTMKTNLTLSKFDLNLEIISLYDRLDKPKAVEFYKRKEDMSWFNADEIVRPDISFIRAVFE